MFESFVNSERCKTETVDNLKDLCNRPMTLSVDELIRFVPEYEYESLRALLIQKDVKQFSVYIVTGKV